MSKRNGELSSKSLTPDTPVNFDRSQFDIESHLSKRINEFSSEIVVGHATIEENERQLTSLKEQVRRIEGARYFAQQLLKEVQNSNSARKGA